MKENSYPKVYLCRRIVQSKLFMDANFSDAINLENIAGEAFFSKFHFIRLFKKIVGCTPHEYLTQIRIEKAKLLLKENSPVASVCFAVGFDSVSSFTGLFKKTTGITPSVFQNQQLQLQADIVKSPLKYIPNCFAEKKGWSAYAGKTTSADRS